MKKSILLLFVASFFYAQEEIPFTTDSTYTQDEVYDSSMEYTTEDTMDDTVYLESTDNTDEIPLDSTDDLDMSPDQVKKIIIQFPNTNITLTPPYAPYQTYDINKLKSNRIPSLVAGQSLLESLDNTVWRLKFYNSPDISALDSILLNVKEPEISITITPAATSAGIKVSKKSYKNIPEENTYKLTLVKALRFGEGIYAYDAGEQTIQFMYLRLILPHLLAFTMAATYEEIILAPDKSLTDVGIFTLE